eukprot:CAMPEP_0194042698 /NCGR_PEP_ID=MMETSP0009_2-20130614/14445_1 /TAXON_ID=210454 /ORGANISM="Grammatophora oceanica, Strain CCMP 410" /LENGTH=73 /DNA_ID=CAMNT_0038686635 /DNA_START=208 /DNA_END=426 /DNA_ORIENTATION=-
MSLSSPVDGMTRLTDAAAFSWSRVWRSSLRKNDLKKSCAFQALVLLQRRLCQKTIATNPMIRLLILVRCPIGK